MKDCNSPGEEICRTEYQSECWSKQIPHEVSTNKQKAAARVKYSNRTTTVFSLSKGYSSDLLKIEKPKQVVSSVSTYSGDTLLFNRHLFSKDP